MRSTIALLAVVAACGDAPRLTPTLLQQAHEFVRSPFSARESLLWAEALGLQSFEADCNGKFARLLEAAEIEDDSCEFTLPVNPAEAVIVSRRQLDSLSPLLSIRDIEGLDAYRKWASRPESAGLQGSSGAGFTVRANLTADDLILVRRPFGAGWLSEPAADVFADPIGFTLIAAKNEGAVEFTLRPISGSSREPGPLPDHEIPIIAPDGIVSAPGYAPPPFQPGDHILIFGERFRTDGTVVRLDDRVLYPDYVGRSQINLRLPADLAPGRYDLTVESAGVSGRAVRCEVAP